MAHSAYTVCANNVVYGTPINTLSAESLADLCAPRIPSVEGENIRKPTRALPMPLSLTIWLRIFIFHCNVSQPRIQLYAEPTSKSFYQISEYGVALGTPDTVPTRPL